MAERAQPGVMATWNFDAGNGRACEIKVGRRITDDVVAIPSYQAEHP